MYELGDWFAVPLRTQGYAIGKVARINDKGILLGYFFSMKFENVPSTEDLDNLKSTEALLLCRFGDLGLKNGSWPTIGQSSGFDPKKWPMPVFGRKDSLVQDRAYKVYYDEDDPNKVLKEERTTTEAVKELPEDGLAGFGFIEIRLTKLIDN